MKEIFEKLSAIDISGQIEKKENLSYLSWANAWTLLVQNYPDSNYTVHQYNGKPYIFDENLGYMVHTSVTVENITKDMYLPVLDGKNKAMLNVDYSYTTKYGDKTVNKATMFDINTSIMRCLVKNIALFGLGLSLYRGEDIIQDQDHINTPKANKVASQMQNMDDNKPWLNSKSPEFERVAAQVPNYSADDLVKLARKKYKVSKETEQTIRALYQDNYEEIVLVD